MSNFFRAAVTERNLRLWIAVSLLLFYLQAIRVIFSVQFGIIYDQIFEGPVTPWLAISFLLLLFSFVLPFLIPVRWIQRILTPVILLIALLRIPMTVNDPIVRFWSAIGILFFVGMYIAVSLWSGRADFFLATVCALCMDIFLRVLGNTLDLSLWPSWLVVQALWSGSILIAFYLLSKSGWEKGDLGGGLAWSGGVAVGGFLFLESSLISLPNALARWAGVPYEVITPLLLLICALPLFAVVRNWLGKSLRTRSMKLILSTLLLLLPMLGYFLSGWQAGISLLVFKFLVLGAWWIILNDERSLGHNASLAIGMLLFFVFVFLNAFAFTYPYTLPEMREKGWLIYLLASALVGIGLLLARQSTAESKTMPQTQRPALALGISLLIAIIVVLAFVWPQASESIKTGGQITIATYNIHYGYDDAWHLALEAQADAIRDAGVEVIALQEVDTGRLTSYAVDNAYYLGRTLGMNVAYLPTVEHLTGIAVLYKGSKAPERSTLLTSLEEQTGIIGVSLDSDLGLEAYGIWLGLEDEDTLRQVEEAIDFIGDRSIVSWGGDFNAEPGSQEVQAIQAAGFIDPFKTLGIDPAPNTSPTINPEKRIDFVFLRGLIPLNAFVSDSLASDHRMVVVEAGILR